MATEKAAVKEVKNEIHKLKKGTAHSGPKLKKVASRKQAVVIGLSKARKKAPKKSESTVKKNTASKKIAGTTKKASLGKKTVKRAVAKRTTATQTKTHRAHPKKTGFLRRLFSFFWK